MYFSHHMIDFISPKSKQHLAAQNGQLVSNAGETFPVVNGIPRFVERDNYAQAFGLQWKTFAKTQLDSHSGTHISQERLERCVGGSIESLKGKNVLEVGCGAGRFTELLVKGGADVHSLDLSEAVEVNKENVGQAPNYRVAQASVYNMPFPDNSFDVVICLGVIQHTPSSENTIRALWQKVKPGGSLVIDHYIWRLGYYSTLTPLYRAVLRRMKPQKSKKIVDSLVDFFFPLHWNLRNNFFLNWLLHRVSPLIVYTKLFPEMGRAEQYEWSKLDTYDQLTDYYKHLRSPAQIQATLQSLGAKNIEVSKGGNGVEARCTKP
jgi:2-polyprenyl-3-methyl-5-hydroxy-6-metoxy-1,4-benzoquinol methylase